MAGTGKDPDKPQSKRGDNRMYVTEKAFVLMMTALALSGCGYYGATHAAMGAATLGTSTLYGAAGGIPGMADRLSIAVRGEPTICQNEAAATTNLDCKRGQEALAVSLAMGKSDPRYDYMARNVARCDAGKIPEPPATEEECDDLRAFKQEIEQRVAELKASGKV
jgi:hypothetical protein